GSAIRPPPPPLRRKSGETSRFPPTPLPPLTGQRTADERPASPSLPCSLGQPDAGAPRPCPDRPAALCTLRAQARTLGARRDNLSLRPALSFSFFPQPPGSVSFGSRAIERS